MAPVPFVEFSTIAKDEYIRGDARSAATDPIDLCSLGPTRVAPRGTFQLLPSRPRAAARGGMRREPPARDPHRAAHSRPSCSHPAARAATGRSSARAACGPLGATRGRWRWHGGNDSGDDCSSGAMHAATAFYARSSMACTGNRMFKPTIRRGCGQGRQLSPFGCPPRLVLRRLTASGGTVTPLRASAPASAAARAVRSAFFPLGSPITAPFGASWPRPPPRRNSPRVAPRTVVIPRKAAVMALRPSAFGNPDPLRARIRGCKVVRTSADHKACGSEVTWGVHRAVGLVLPCSASRECKPSSLPTTNGTKCARIVLNSRIGLTCPRPLAIGSPRLSVPDPVANADAGHILRLALGLPPLHACTASPPSACRRGVPRFPSLCLFASTPLP